MQVFVDATEMKTEPFEHLEGDAEILSQRLTRSLSSPFGQWSTSANQPVAIAMLSVYGLIFLAGLIGHVCVVAYAVSSRRKYRTNRRGALLILANLSTAHMLFLLCCLPSIAYKSIMNLTFEPWILGDITCRMVPFVEIFILGVTVLSFCVLSIDRLRSAGQNTKTYEEAGDSCVTGMCKIFVIWLGAIIIASPEIFVYGTTKYELQIPETVFKQISGRDPSLTDGISIDLYQKLENPEESWRDLKQFFGEFRTKYVTDTDDLAQTNVTTFGITYQYEKCERGVSLWDDSPNFLVTFMHTYENVRLWWLFGFYFCLPVFFSLLFAMIIARRLTAAHDKCLKDFGTYPVDGAVGTLTSHKGGSMHRSNSLASNQTASSEAQQLMLATEGRSGALTPNNGSLRNHLSSHRSASPAGSYPSMMTPMIVRSSNAPISPTNENGNGYAQSVISPSVTSPSMTSVIYDVNGKTASLPPHGRGSRSRGKVQRIILFNVARDRALNSLLVALILAFSLTWLPQHIFHILFAKTQLQEALEEQYVVLILDICRYLSSFSFAVNPAVVYLAYKSYRLFLDKFCCPCQCR